tara:strand:- start:128 stop:433 length:306 start_codon:yes stop_codon:yes gene_type:complete
MIKLLFIFFIFSFLIGCQSVKDGIALKKKEAADEFLVEKKNPLVEPPEFGQLPVPGEKPNLNESSNDNIKNILSKGNNEVSQNEPSTKKIEENILDKIKNR